MGAQEYTWRGEAFVRRKAEWPNWVPMEEARKLNPALPKVVNGGPDNRSRRARPLHVRRERQGYLHPHPRHE